MIQTVPRVVSKNAKAAAILEEAAKLATAQPYLYSLVGLEAKAARAVAACDHNDLARAKQALLSAKLSRIAKEY